MSDNLTVRITATDGASKVFQQVGKAAQSAGDSIEKAGKEGAAGLDKIEQEAKQAGPAVEKVGDSAKRAGVDMIAMGAALGTAAGVMAQLGQSFREQERQISGIQALYGQQSDTILQMAEDIQSFTRYSNDAARESSLFASSLVTNYEMSAESVAMLVERSADLAQIFGTDLVDAVTRTSGAIRGEGEAAERLGLNLSDAAVAARALDAGITNWNVPGALTEAEKAAFRFELFLQDTEKTVGAAADAADNAGGRFRQFANEMQDAGQSVGGFLGPVGQVAAEMAPLTLALPLIGAGAAKMAAGLNTARIAASGFVATPLGAAITIVGGALALATAAWLDHRNEMQANAQMAQDAAESFEALGKVIGELRFEDWADAQWATDLTHNVLGEFSWLSQNMEQIVADSFGTGNWLDKIITDQLGPIKVNPQDYRLAWENIADDMIESMMPDAGDEKRFTDAMANLLSLSDVEGVNFDAIQAEIQRLFDAFNAADGAISVDQFIASLINLFNANLAAAQSIDKTTIATNALAAATQTASDLGADSIFATSEAYTELTGQVDQATEATRELALAQREANNERGTYARDSAAAQDEWWAEQRTRKDAADEETRALVERRRAMREATGDIVAGEREIGRAITESMGEAKAAVEEFAAAREEAMLGLLTSLTGMDDPLTQWNATSLASEFSMLAAEVINAGTALDTVFRVVVGNTNAIAQQADAVHSWAEELINIEGEYGKIDDLLNDGLITIDQYNAAQQAYNSIAMDNASIQEYTLKIQAMQAPLIAAQTSALENQLEVVSRLPAQQQLTALAWMDSATAAKAMEINTLAAAVATGELGSVGERAFTSYVESIAQTNPALFALLEDMQLVTDVVRAADGTVLSYEINLDGAEGARSEISMLTDSINQLIMILGGVPPLYLDIVGDDVVMAALAAAEAGVADLNGDSATVYAEGQDNASPVMNGVQAGLNALNGNSATVSVFANDLASGVLGGISGMLNALDGRTATTYIRTVGLSETARHGGIPGFAMGGTVVPFIGGEAGAEVAHFASGGSAVLPTHSMYAAPPMTYISPANANPGAGRSGMSIQIDVHGNIYGIDDLTEQVTRQLVPALAEASGTRYREQGVNW